MSPLRISKQSTGKSERTIFLTEGAEALNLDPAKTFRVRIIYGELVKQKQIIISREEDWPVFMSTLKECFGRWADTWVQCLWIRGEGQTNEYLDGNKQFSTAINELHEECVARRGDFPMLFMTQGKRRDTLEHTFNPDNTRAQLIKRNTFEPQPPQLLNPLRQR